MSAGPPTIALAPRGGNVSISNAFGVPPPASGCSPARGPRASRLSEQLTAPLPRSAAPGRPPALPETHAQTRPQGRSPVITRSCRQTAAAASRMRREQEAGPSRAAPGGTTGASGVRLVFLPVTEALGKERPCPQGEPSSGHRSQPAPLPGHWKATVSPVYREHIARVSSRSRNPV